MDYEQLKQKFVENKDKWVLVLCFAVVFLVGFGSGRFDRHLLAKKQKEQVNYTTNTKQDIATKQESPTPTVEAATTNKTASTTQTCLIKGNISSTGTKIYHVKGGAFYDRTTPEQCFNTEAEAQAAGFRKSSR